MWTGKERSGFWQALPGSLQNVNCLNHSEDPPGGKKLYLQFFNDTNWSFKQ